jgi:hypothetical protein
MGNIGTIEENKIAKYLEHKASTEDVIADPRSWSPKDLKEACDNVKILFSIDIEKIEAASIHFLLKDFFYIMHQTGLYNLQRKVWNMLGKGKKIKIKKQSFKEWGSKEKYRISDIEISDTSGNKTLIIRVIHNQEGLHTKNICHAFNKLISCIPSKCLGVFFISPLEYEKIFLNKVKEKTKSFDSINKYKSPLNKNCSLNLFQYEFVDDSYVFRLIHPYLEREIKTIVGFNS